MTLILLIACAADSQDLASAEPVEPLEQGVSCPEGSRFYSPDPNVEACVDSDGELVGPWRRWDGEQLVASASYRQGELHGDFIGWHADGSLEESGRYVTGDKDGRWRRWRTDGKLDSSERWDEGELQERREHGLDGELLSELHFHLGKRDGLATWWYPDGMLRSRVEYSHGQRDGAAVQWHADGSLKSLGSYTADQRDGSWLSWDAQGALVSQETWDLGELMSVQGSQPVASGEACPSGTRPLVRELERGRTELCETPAGVLHGPMIARYEDGSLRRVGRYKGGLPEGDWTTWCADGMSASTGRYEAGDRVGTWTFWSCADGELVRTEEHGLEDVLVRRF